MSDCSDCVKRHCRPATVRSSPVTENLTLWPNRKVAQFVSRMRCSATRMQASLCSLHKLKSVRVVVHRWSGTATGTELGTVPGRQRSTTQSSLRRLRKLHCVCCAAPGTRVEALYADCSAWRNVAARPTGLGFGTELGQSLGPDRGPQAVHQLLIISEVHCREEDRPQHLAALDEVVEIGARKVPRRRARARLVERAGIVGMARVLDVDRSKPSEGDAVAAVAGGQHAVEHVDAAGDGFENVRGHPHAHEVARTIGG